jgi:hypothetical protein
MNTSIENISIAVFMVPGLRACEEIGQLASLSFRMPLGRPGTDGNIALPVFPEGRLPGFRARGQCPPPE